MRNRSGILKEQETMSRIKSGATREGLRKTIALLPKEHLR